jgi:hypothetical protein
MAMIKKTWKGKRIEKEEEGDSLDQETGIAGKENQTSLEINMVFQLPQEFMWPEPEMAQLTLGAEMVVIEKPEAFGQHMKPLYIRGHLDGVPMNHMLVDGGPCVNIMPGSVLERLGHKDDELLKTNMTVEKVSI